MSPRLLYIVIVKKKNKVKLRAQLLESRLALNPGLNLTWVSFSGVQKHFVG